MMEDKVIHQHEDSDSVPTALKYHYLVQYFRKKIFKYFIFVFKDNVSRLSTHRIRRKHELKTFIWDMILEATKTKKKKKRKEKKKKQSK